MRACDVHTQKEVPVSVIAAALGQIQSCFFSEKFLQMIRVIRYLGTIQPEQISRCIFHQMDLRQFTCQNAATISLLSFK